MSFHHQVQDTKMAITHDLLKKISKIHEYMAATSGSQVSIMAVQNEFDLAASISHLTHKKISAGC